MSYPGRTLAGDVDGDCAATELQASAATTTSRKSVPRDDIRPSSRPDWLQRRALAVVEHQLNLFDLRARHEWPLAPALAVSVLVVAPLLGLALDRLLFQHLRSASQLAKLVTSLGLLVALPEITAIWFGKGAAFNPPAIGDLTRIIRFGAYTSTVDGVEKDDLQKNTRVGLTLAVPLSRRQSLKFGWATGASTRLGQDFDNYAVAWQYRWGAGR